jgi:uncharacterized protein
LVMRMGRPDRWGHPSSLYAFNPITGCSRKDSPAHCTLSATEEGVEPATHVMYNVHMLDLRFEWNDAKSRQNVRKHGVSFDEAQTVFLDDHAIRFYDPDHSQDEDRFIMLGRSVKLRILVVCHCCKENDSLIRIISARKATRHEATQYGR